MLVLNKAIGARCKAIDNKVIGGEMATKDKMYHGTIEMAYDPIKHMYTVNGLRVPSVTTVTGVMDKPALIPWAVNETINYVAGAWRPESKYSREQIDGILKDAKSARFRTSQKALNIGREAHEWVEAWIKGKILNIPTPPIPDYPPVRTAIESYLEWERATRPLYLSSERRVYSLKHMYSGTLDTLAVIDGAVTVTDLKTSKGIYPEYFIQCAAYAQAVSEEDDIKIGRLSVIRIPKDGGVVEVETRSDVDNLFSVFNACLTIWRWKNNWDPKSPDWNIDNS